MSERKEARDWSVRNLPPPSAAERRLAERLGADVYDGRRAAADAGLPQLELDPRRAWLARFKLW